uniref:Ammonium transporter AmtB-like domain-containing protein n=1 Tax=Bionectria ochroleuca TaxID=29856 RepID=A0A8H7K405_BIOOC
MAVDWEQFDKTDILFIIFCSTICWQIVPAVGLAYAGYSTRRNAMSAIYTSLLVLIVCTIQWYLIGYSIAYSDGNGLFGDLSHAFHIGAIWEPMGTIPTLLFSQFQLIFCATVAAISIGGSV